MFSTITHLPLYIGLKSLHTLIINKAFAFASSISTNEALATSLAPPITSA